MMTRLTTVVAALAVTLSIFNLTVRADTLGAATDFSVVTFGNLTVHAADAEGRVLVGGNMSSDLSYNWVTASSLSQSSGTRDDLIVGGNLSVAGTWWLTKGNFRIGGDITSGAVGPSNSNVYSTGYDIHSLVDFNALYQQISDQSAAYGSLNQTLVDSDPNTNFQFIITTPGVHVINFGQENVNLNASTGAIDFVLSGVNASDVTVILNFLGPQVTFTGGSVHLNGLSASHVLYNFPQATLISMSNYSAEGSLIAPDARLELANGHINGSTIVNEAEVYTGGEFHNVPFTGDLPPVPEPATLALFALGGIAMLPRRR